MNVCIDFNCSCSECKLRQNFFLLDTFQGNDNTHFEKEGPGKRERRRGRGGRGRGRGNLFHPNGGRGQTVGTPPQSSSLLTTEMKPPPGPRMPDGTRGFSLGRGKPLAN